MVETKKILDPKIKLSATCVRVPVFVGHSEAVNIEFEKEISAAQARSILREAPGIMLVDKQEDGGYVTPVECVGDYATFVSRVREDPTVDNGLSLWVVSDNLRKGAALNAVQIAELLGRKHLEGGLALLAVQRAREKGDCLRSFEPAEGLSISDRVSAIPARSLAPERGLYSYSTPFDNASSAGLGRSRRGGRLMPRSRI